MLKRRLMFCIAAVALSGAAAPAGAAPWTRGFVVSSYQFAFRYGGRPGFNRRGEIEPGVDCPHGSTVNFSAYDPDTFKSVLARQKWRSQQEIDWITDPPGLESAKTPSETRASIWSRAISYRGYRKGIETYLNPWAAEDPGQPEVTSRIADGFNLDGKIGARDFVGPDGELGIDNALYRAWGCDAPWRGDGNAAAALFADNQMQRGLHTMVIRVSGSQDPMNDADATLEIGYSPDKIVMDGRGGVAVDYSHRILQSSQYTKLRAKIKDGVVETEQVKHLHTPRLAGSYDQTGDSDFINGKIRLNIATDGLSASGLIGGYRSWEDLYVESITNAQNAAGELDVGNGQDRIALYYALRRNADGMYNKMTGRYDGLSTAYSVKAVSAYVVDPGEPMDIPVPLKEPNMLRYKKVAEQIKINFAKGVETRIPQDVPLNSPEAFYPNLEQRFSDGLPNRDYFLKMLDRPHFPDGAYIDDRGRALDDQGRPLTGPAAVP
ncbi:hypothetical protein ACWGRJ_40595 [Bradyrhizobium sp. Lot11]